MSKYVQSSTENPSGQRPWLTRLYTGFEDYGFLKQPQNSIVREDTTMRPEIYQPPDFNLGDVTLVTGSGRVVQRGRRRRGLGLLPAMMDRSTYTGTTSIYRSPYVNAPITSQLPLVTAPASTMVRATETPVWMASRPPALPIESPIVAPKPLTILPPPSVPAPPQPARTQTGTIYVSPGSAPYIPPAGFPAPSTPPIAPLATLPSISTASPSGSSPDGSAAAAAPSIDVSSLSDWFNSSTWINGVPNGYVAIGIVGAIFLFSRKKR